MNFDMSYFNLTLVFGLLILLPLSIAWIVHKVRYSNRYPEIQRLAVNYVRDNKTDHTAHEGEFMGSHGVDHFPQYLLSIEQSIVVLVKTIYFRGGCRNGMTVHFVTVDPKRFKVISCTTPFEALERDDIE